MVALGGAPDFSAAFGSLGFGAASPSASIFAMSAAFEAFHEVRRSDLGHCLCAPR
jgi:hypothetical protein